MAAFLSTRVLQFLSPPLTRSMRGLQYKWARTLDQRTCDMREAKGVIDLPMINIGFPEPTISQYKMDKIKGESSTSIDLEKIRQDWQKTTGMKHIKNTATHYGIYRDMFSNGYFYPTTQLEIFYNDENAVSTPIYYGNHLKPAEMKSKPEIVFSSDSQSLWTLVATNLDCHFEKDSHEYLLWLVGNISGNDLSTGETICDYLQPFPAKGLGYQRVVFVLYKQNKRINYESIKRNQPCLVLKDRTFLSNDFYKEHESEMTPAGLAFCQVDWDESMTDFFHNVLKMREPRFEYDHEPQFIKPQVWNPHRKQFDTYLDKYRPREELNEEVLLMRLKRSDPFKEPEIEQYPLVHKVPDTTATWIRKQMRQQHLRWAKYRDL